MTMPSAVSAMIKTRSEWLVRNQPLAKGFVSSDVAREARAWLESINSPVFELGSAPDLLKLDCLFGVAWHEDATLPPNTIKVEAR